MSNNANVFQTKNVKGVNGVVKHLTLCYDVLKRKKISIYKGVGIIMKNPNLHKDSIKSLFYFYLSSSIIGMIIRSLHNFLDGVFVGNGVSEEALAAVNMSLPLMTSFTAISFLFSVGGATYVSIELGRGNPKKAQNYFISSMFSMLAVVIVIQTIFFTNRPTIIRLLGANDTIYDLIYTYGSTIMVFAPLMAISLALSIFVRNDGNPKLVMQSNVIGAIANAAMNGLFIFGFNWGLFGAALGTGLAQIVSTGILLRHFMKKDGNLHINLKGYRYSLSNMKRVMQVGFPNWIGEIAFGIIWLVLNRVIMNINGEIGVSAFSITFYVCNMGYAVMYGVAQAIQPIISFNFGATHYDRVKEAYKLGLYDALKIGGVFLIITVVFAEPIVKLFGADSRELIQLAVSTNRYVALTFLFVAYNIVGSTFFQSIGDGTTSLILQLIRGFFLTLFFILVLPKFLGFLGIMLAFPLTELISALITWTFMKTRQKVM